MLSGHAVARAGGAAACGSCVVSLPGPARTEASGPGPGAFRLSPSPRVGRRASRPGPSPAGTAPRRKRAISRGAPVTGSGETASVGEWRPGIHTTPCLAKAEQRWLPGGRKANPGTAYGVGLEKPGRGWRGIIARRWPPSVSFSPAAEKTLAQAWRPCPQESRE